jgi:hypothetical protein
MDGDGDLDLAVGNVRVWYLSCSCYVHGNNKVYLNDGGRLQATAAWQSVESDSIQSVAWGDMDGDGDLDLAAGNSPLYDANCGCFVGGENRVYLNQGGQLQTTAAWNSTESDGTTSVAWGDMDGDGDLDLAMGNDSRPNRVYLLQTTAAWSSAESDGTNSVAWGDMDGDGDLDLAVGNASAPNRVYLNEGVRLQTTADWNSMESDYTNSVAWGDMDGDPPEGAWASPTGSISTTGEGCRPQPPGSRWRPTLL